MNKFFFLIVLFIINLLPSILFSQVRVDAGGSNTAPYNTWGKAATDIQNAINYANSNGISEVWITGGTYNLSATIGLRNNVTVYGGFHVGDVAVGQRDWSGNPTIISGQNARRVIYQNGGGINSSCVIDGVVIQDGSASSGGGLYIRNCSPTFRNCIIRNNTSTGTSDGGGMYLRAPTTSQFTNCTFELNTSGRDGGAAILTSSGCNPNFSSCTFQNNTCADDGGGLYITNSGCNPTFSSCTIDANHSGDHGGGAVINGCNPVFTNCNITNNVLDNAGNNGGGLCLWGASNPNVTNCTITGNTATNYGGGIYSQSSAWANTISGNTISNNTVSEGNAYGGGIYLDNSAPDISSNTISNNTVTTTANNSRSFGGGIYLTGNDISPNISGNIINGNTATTTGVGTGCGRGGAIYCNQSPATISLNTIKNNTVSTSGGGASCGYGGGIYLYRTLVNTINNNTISNNNAQYYGGGIYMYQSDPTLTSNTIDGNIVTGYLVNTGYGGGIVVYDDTGSGTSPVFNSNTIVNNQANDGGNATSGYGGGVYLRSGVDAVFTGNTIENNSSSQRGGGIYYRDGGTNTIFNRNMIKGNNSANGGAVYIDGNIAFEFYNNIFHHNTATNGAGIFFRNTDSGTFLNNTLSQNTAIDGGGVYFTNDADVHLTNTILWNNSATGSGNQVYINDNGSDPYFQYCDVEGGRAAFAGAGSGGSYNAGHYSNNIEVDPIFLDGVYHITKGTSPCIGAGNPATGVGNFPSDEDYDAEKRVRGTVDIGAYETNNDPQFVTLPYPPTTDNPGPENITMDEDANPTAFNLTLNAIDLDDENIIWTIAVGASNGTAGITSSPTNPPNAQSQVITYTPNANYNGNDNFVVQVSDGTLIDQITVNVTINSINDEPYFVSSPVTTGKATHLYTYNIVTNDVDLPAQALTITCPVKPAWLTFTDNGDRTALLTGTPADGDIGIHNVTLQVSDGTVSKQQVFTINVADRFIYVPADYPTIQQGIDAAAAGDKIIVAAGTYPENINTNGKTIEIEGDPTTPSNVIIDGGGSGAVVTIDQGGSATINGFTVTNGTGRIGHPSVTTIHAPSQAHYGGGIYCYQSSPTLKNIHITGNTLQVSGNNGGSGAGIYICNNSNVTIEGPNTIIQNNKSTTYRGGGICSDDSNLTIDGTVANGVKITGNSSGNYGAGISITNTNLDLTRVQITGNTLSGMNARGADLYNHTSNVTTHAGVSISVRYDFP